MTVEPTRQASASSLASSMAPAMAASESSVLAGLAVTANPEQSRSIALAAATYASSSASAAPAVLSQGAKKKALIPALLPRVFSHLELEELVLVCPFVCKEWNTAANTSIVFTPYIVQQFPNANDRILKLFAHDGNSLKKVIGYSIKISLLTLTKFAAPEESAEDNVVAWQIGNFVTRSTDEAVSSARRGSSDSESCEEDSSAVSTPESAKSLPAGAELSDQDVEEAEPINTLEAGLTQALSMTTPLINSYIDLPESATSLRKRYGALDMARPFQFICTVSGSRMPGQSKMKNKMEQVFELYKAAHLCNNALTAAFNIEKRCQDTGKQLTADPAAPAETFLFTPGNCLRLMELLEVLPVTEQTMALPYGSRPKANLVGVNPLLSRFESNRMDIVRKLAKI